MRQLGRFLRLERVRKDNERPATALPTRFASIEEALDSGSSASSVSHAVTHLERFAPEADQPAVLEAYDAGQPFVRCVSCGADSSRHSTVCAHCEARLDTAENRTFNERLWAEATAARQRESEELRRLQKLRQGESEMGAPVSQGAAELAARARAQLALDELEGADTPTWLQSVRSSALRGPFVVLALGLGVPGFLLAVSHRSPVGVVVSVALAAVLLVAARRAP